MGFEIEFVDISLETLAIDENKLEETLNKHDDISSISHTCSGHQWHDTQNIELCKRNKIHLFEDVCESHGVVLDSGKKAGAEGIISNFSFYYAHHMSTIEGGMICTNDPDIYQYMRMIRSHGMLRESTDDILKKGYSANNLDLNPLFIFTYPGFNVRNNEIGAMIGISQLRRLDEMITKRANNFEYFLSKMPDWVYTDFCLKGQSNYAFNLILKSPDKKLMSRVEKRCDEENIEYRKGSAGGGNQIRQPYVQSLTKFKNQDPSKLAPVTDHIHFYGMYLGNYPELSKNEIDSLCSIIRSI